MINMSLYNRYINPLKGRQTEEFVKAFESSKLKKKRYKKC